MPSSRTATNSPGLHLSRDPQRPCETSTLSSPPSYPSIIVVVSPNRSTTSSTPHTPFYLSTRCVSRLYHRFFVCFERACACAVTTIASTCDCARSEIDYGASGGGGSLIGDETSCASLRTKGQTPKANDGIHGPEVNAVRTYKNRSINKQTLSCVS